MKMGRRNTISSLGLIGSLLDHIDQHAQFDDGPQIVSGPAGRLAWFSSGYFGSTSEMRILKTPFTPLVAGTYLTVVAPVVASGDRPDMAPASVSMLDLITTALANGLGPSDTFEPQVCWSHRALATPAFGQPTSLFAPGVYAINESIQGAAPINNVAWVWKPELMTGYGHHEVWIYRYPRLGGGYVAPLAPYGGPAMSVRFDVVASNVAGYVPPPDVPASYFRSHRLFENEIEAIMTRIRLIGGGGGAGPYDADRLVYDDLTCEVYSGPQS